MQSLFIISLPRSLSTHIQYQCTITLKLQSPKGVDAGEILNSDRYFISRESIKDLGFKYTPPGDNFNYRRMMEFLDTEVQPIGYIYKDVVQPFVVSGWLRTNEMPILRIKRSITDVALSMIRKGWSYPGNAATTEKDMTRAIIQGLIRADHVLKGLSAEVVEFDTLLENESVLQAALQKLYPHVEIPPFRYRDDLFLKRKNEIQALRFTKEWLELDNLVNKLLTTSPTDFQPY